MYFFQTCILNCSNNCLNEFIESNYGNFACIPHTSLHKFLHSNWGCILYAKLEIEGVLHRAPNPHGDPQSMALISTQLTQTARRVILPKTVGMY